MAFGGAACSVATDEDVASEGREAPGVLKVPLRATAESGAVYVLRAEFEIRRLDDSLVERITTDDPDSDTLSLSLEAGEYRVVLLDGWSLERLIDGGRVEVPATLISAVSVEVRIRRKGESVVVFRFSTPSGEVPCPKGDLDIGIEVEETEACSGGPTCPLHVDPDAPPGGDGSSWAEAMTDLQTAIDTQNAAGGGEVWVIGGGPFPELTGSLTTTLVELREDVAVYGGFAGTELLREERDPAGRTVILGAPPDDYASAPLISAASDATLDGFAILGQSGVALEVDGVSDFQLVNVAIIQSINGPGSPIVVQNSSAAFNGLELRESTSVSGVGGLFIEDSNLIVAHSFFERVRVVSSEPGAIGAIDSTLVLDDVRFELNDGGPVGTGSALGAEDSDILAIDSVWLRNFGDRGAVVVEGSRFVAVSSHWERNAGIGPAASMLDGTIAAFLNSSFVSNRAQAFGTLYAADSELEVVNTSFFDNIVDPGIGLPDVPDDIGFAGAGQPSLYNSYSDKGAGSIFPPFTGAGNCLLAGSMPSLTTVDGVTQVLLQPAFGCVDTGDTAAAIAAAIEAGDFADSLGIALGLSGNWWQALTSVLGLANDPNVIDSGRHY